MPWVGVGAILISPCVRGEKQTGMVCAGALGQAVCQSLIKAITPDQALAAGFWEPEQHVKAQ